MSVVTRGAAALGFSPERGVRSPAMSGMTVEKDFRLRS